MSHRYALRLLGVMVLALLAAPSLFAQQRVAVPSTSATYDGPVVRGSEVLRVYDPETDTQNLAVLADDGGYVFGANTYGDLAKAVCFDLPEGQSEIVVDQVNIFLVRSELPMVLTYDLVLWDGAPGYDDDAENGAGPQSVIYSEAFNIEEIESLELPAEAREHTLATPQAISGPFCAGIQWDGAATPGDIGIVNTEALEEPSPHEWELWSGDPPVWHNMSDAWTSIGWHAWVDVLYTGSVSNEDGSQPERSALSSVYPNPFASRASFDVTVSTPQHVAVEVFNVLGQQVATVFRGTLSDTRSLTIDGTRLQPGVYVVRVQGEDFTESRKVVVNR